MKNIIICPGSINPDYMIQSNSEYKMSNKTITFFGESFTYHGGKGCNQAISAKRSGSKVKLIGCVGNDLEGKNAITYLTKNGIDVRDIKFVNKKTGRCIWAMFKKGYQIVGLDKGANENLTIKDINKISFKKFDALLCQIENNSESTIFSLKKAKQNNLITVLNASIPTNNVSLNNQMLNYTDILVVNLGEAKKMLNLKINNVKKLGFNLAKKVNFVIITLGEKGSILFSKNNFKKINAFKVKEIDTGACGDIYCGALVSYFKELNYEEIIKAMYFASATAAISVTKKGASESSPKKKEVIDFLKKRKIDL
jgi:ribokinase